jgi:hypothetical protein
MKFAFGLIAAALLALAASPGWTNPPGYDSSWTSKEAADRAITADHAYNECMFHHRQEDQGSRPRHRGGVPCGVLDGAR